MMKNLKVACELTEVSESLKTLIDYIDVIHYCYLKGDRFSSQLFFESNRFSDWLENVQTAQKKIQHISDEVCPDNDTESGDDE